MITPGYSPTATERVLPRMALDFTTASLDSRVTVTRALNTATRFNSSGYLETVNANLPRFDFNPSTLVCRGLLIEESRENITSYSNAFTTAPWQTAGTVTSAQNITGPDNVANSAWTLTDNDAASICSFYRALGVVDNSAAYSFSVFIKKTSGATTFPALNINILGGSVGVLAAYALNTNTGVATAASSNETPSSAVVQDAGGFWRFCISTANNSTGNYVVYYGMSPAVNTNGGSTFVASTTGSAVFYGAQLEVGAFATSYIPTTTTSLTRNADVVGMTGTNFSDWYSSTTGSMLAEWDIPNITGTKCAYYLTNAAETERIRLHASLSNINRYTITSSGASIVFDTAAATTGVTKSVVGFKASDYAVSFNGAAVATNTTLATVPTTPNQLQIGRDGASSYLNGWMRRVAYWPQRLINSEVQSFAK